MIVKYELNIFRDFRGKDAKLSVNEHDDHYSLIMTDGMDHIHIDVDEKQVSEIAYKADAALTPEWAIDAGSD